MKPKNINRKELTDTKLSIADPNSVYTRYGNMSRADRKYIKNCLKEEKFNEGKKYGYEVQDA